MSINAFVSYPANGGTHGYGNHNTCSASTQLFSYNGYIVQYTDTANTRLNYARSTVVDG